MWWALLACSNSGLDKPDPVPTGDTAPAPVNDCEWVGTRTLSEVKCGAFDYPTFFDTYTGATLTVSQGAATGCEVVATLTSATCSQTESWSFAVPVGVEAELTRNGVSSCDPAGCSHGGTACTVGANVVPAETVTLDDSAPGTLTAKGLFPETGPTCLPDLGLVTVWTSGP